MNLTPQQKDRMRRYMASHIQNELNKHEPYVHPSVVPGCWFGGWIYLLAFLVCVAIMVWLLCGCKKKEEDFNPAVSYTEKEHFLFDIGLSYGAVFMGQWYIDHGSYKDLPSAKKIRETCWMRFLNQQNIPPTPTSISGRTNESHTWDIPVVVITNNLQKYDHSH